MKVLSIQQPFASLCAMGIKKIETRSWNTKFRGEFLIHAAAGKKYEYLYRLRSFYQFLPEKMLKQNFDDLPFGAIIGKAELVEVAPLDLYIDKLDSLNIVIEKPGRDETWPLTEQEIAFGDYSPGRFGWLLSNAILFDKPIPAKGQQGWWN